MMSLEDTEHKKYLGDVIYSNGRNEKNIEERKKEVAMMLSSSHLINGIFTNAEAW